MTLLAEDRSEILDLLARVAWAMDERLVDEFVDQFTPSAVIVRQRRSAEPRRWGGGAAPLSDFVSAAWTGVHVEDVQTWTTDVEMSEASDHVTVVSNSLRVGSSSGGLANVLLADAEVRDTVVRRANRWQIAERIVVPLGARGAEDRAVPAVLDGGGGSEPTESTASTDASSDRIEIEALFADYAWALDTADIEAVLLLFSEDAVMQDPYGRFTGSGPDGVRRFFEGLFARPEFAGRIHWVSQLLLTPIDGGYRADSYAVVPASFGAGGVNIHLVAFYRDVVVRERGRWKFRERLVGPRWPRLVESVTGSAVSAM